MRKILMSYYVYIVRCKDETLYTGITTDVVRRIREHNASDALGAKYTKYRRPVVLVYEKEFSSRSSASIEEARIKKLSRVDKMKFITTK